MHHPRASLVRGRRQVAFAATLALIFALAACSFDPGAPVPAPQGLRVVERDGGVDLAWLPVEALGILGYHVYVAPAEPPSDSFELVAEVDAGTTTATIDGLANFTAYRFVVRTVAVLGVSDASAPVLGAPFSVASVPIDRFESDDEGEVAVLADGSRFRLLTLEEVVAWDGPEPPDFELDVEAAISTSAAGPPQQLTHAAYQTNIRYQGKRDTCQTFAAVAAVEAAYLRHGFGARDLSEQFATHIYRTTHLRTPVPATADTRENTLGMRSGGSVSGILSRLVRYRIPLETAAPYVFAADYENPNQNGDVPRIDPNDANVLQSTYNDWNLQDEPTTYRIPTTFTHTPFPRAALIGGSYGITGFSKVPTASRHDPAWYEQVLASGHEIAFGFCFRDGGGGGDSVWRTGAATANCRGHAVLLIGYDRSDPDDPVFVAKNSWGGNAYQRLEYAFVTDPAASASAYVAGNVINPFSSDAIPQLALGRWDLVYDGDLATLDVNRLSGFFDTSTLDGQQDRRLGALFSAGGTAHRVNGTIADGSRPTNIVADFFVDFDNPALDYETLSGKRFTGYVSRAEPLFMAGTFRSPGNANRFGFYAHKDGPVPSVPGGPANDLNGYLGTWRILGLGGDSHLVITQMLASGAFSGVTTHDAASVFGSVDIANETITVELHDRSGAAGSALAHLHDGDPGTASGTLVRDGDFAGIALVRIGSTPSVVIDHLGTLREDGTVTLGATVQGFVDSGAVTIEWRYRVGATGPSVAFATSTSGEVFTANLPCEGLVLTARAVDASRGLAADDVAALSCLPASSTQVFHADRDVSGWVNTNADLATAAAGDVLLVGDDGFDRGYRSYLTFDWNLPEDLTAIDAAEVTIFLDSVQGTPYSTLNDLRAFHVDYGDTLDADDYAGFTPLPGAATLPFDATTTFGSLTFDATVAMQDAWANRATRGDRLQLVLLFQVSTDGDGQSDLATFLAEDRPGTTLLPFVEITYGNY